MMPPAATTPRVFHGFNVSEVIIVWYVAQGMNDEQIARAMRLNIVTVKWYASHILRRLGLKNRTQLALRAISAGLVQLDQIHIQHGHGHNRRKGATV